IYRPGDPGVVLCDYDTHGMPENICGVDFWDALTGDMLPTLHHVAMVARKSTSTGIRRRSDNTPVGDSRGRHVYIFIRDVSDSDRFLRVLHKRVWLAGLGWYALGKDGALLERSIIDRMVGSPERLVFEGVPVLSDDLMQEPRTCEAFDGGLLDTRT